MDWQNIWFLRGIFSNIFHLLIIYEYDVIFKTPDEKNKLLNIESLVGLNGWTSMYVRYLLRSLVTVKSNTK